MNLFEAKLAYKIFDDELGKDVKKSESYVIEAVTFGECETIMNKQIEDMGLKDYEIKNIKPISYSEIFYENGTVAEDNTAWYKAKVEMETENDGKVKKVKFEMIVKESDIDAASKLLKEKMKGTIDDWAAISISKSDIYAVVLKD